MGSSRPLVVALLIAGLVRFGPGIAIAGDLDTRDGGALPPVELVEPPVEWHSRAVNSDGGVPVPALFGGSSGLCFPAAEAPVVVRILRSSYPTCRERALRLVPLLQVALDWKTKEAVAASGALAALDASLTVTKAALEKADVRAEKLAAAIAPSSGTSWWVVFASFVAGGLIAVGLSHALPR